MSTSDFFFYYYHQYNTDNYNDDNYNDYDNSIDIYYM